MRIIRVLEVTRRIQGIVQSDEAWPVKASDNKREIRIVVDFEGITNKRRPSDAEILLCWLCSIQKVAVWHGRRGRQWKRT